MQRHSQGSCWLSPTLTVDNANSTLHLLYEAPGKKTPLLAVGSIHLDAGFSPVVYYRFAAPLDRAADRVCRSVQGWNENG
jgi:hypothetical protein